MQRWATRGLNLLLFSICCATALAQARFATLAKASAQPSVPYNLGNWTYVSEVVFPVKIDENQIPVGANWTYVYTLSENSTYHVYCYGDWIDYEPDSPKTDYDIFVYDPVGDLESYHTEAAGLHEHLGTTVDQPFFTPKHTGNYSLLVENDPRESQGAKEATLMLIEHVRGNKWYRRYMEGKVDDKPVENTSWACEFIAKSRHVEILIEVPETLDMYEARLYIMANPSGGMGDVLNGVPLAWEPGLYGGFSGIYGGYNLDSEGFRHEEAIASCEFPGEDMLINYTAPTEGTLLYHLVLIAEHGDGNLNFMVKTDFEAPKLSIKDPVEAVYPNETTVTVYVEEHYGLDTIQLNYTSNGWATWTAIEMTASQNQTYIGKIPEQTAGTKVKYRVLASDEAGNRAEVQGGYVVKNPTDITLALSKSVIHYGENVTVTGSISQGGAKVTLNYTSSEVVAPRLLSTNSSGLFTDTYFPNETGSWLVVANWAGNETCFGASSGYRNLTVEKTPMSITCNTTRESVTVGQNITVIGSVHPIVENLAVTLVFTASNGSVIEQHAYTNSNATFVTSFKPSLVGSWRVRTRFDGDDFRSEAHSESKFFRVKDTWINQYMIYLMGAVVGVIAVIIATFVVRRRMYE